MSPIFTQPHFAADQAGCPTCRLELVRHPVTGLWTCPSCHYARATLHEAITAVSTRPAIAAALKVMTETLEQIRPTGVMVETEQTTVEESNTDEAPAQSPDVSECVTLDELVTRWGLTKNGVRSRLERHAVEIVRDPHGQLAAREADLAGRDWAQRTAPSAGNGHASEPAPKPEGFHFERLHPASVTSPEVRLGDVPGLAVERALASGRGEAPPDLGEAPWPRRAEPAPGAAPAEPASLGLRWVDTRDIPTRVTPAEPPSAEPTPPAASAPAERPPAFAPLYGNDAGRVRRLLLALERINTMANKYSEDVWILPAIAALASYAIEAES